MRIPSKLKRNRLAWLTRLHTKRQIHRTELFKVTHPTPEVTKGELKTMKIKISKAVSRDVRPAIEFAFKFAQAKAKSLGKNIAKAQAVVTSCNSDGNCFRGYWGRAWPGQMRVLLRIGPLLPPHQHRYAKFQNMPCFDMAGGDESVVYLAAHEFGHLIGWAGDKAGEISCCKFGYAAVEAWRDRQYQCPACLI